MIFDWFKPHTPKLSEPKPMWEYSEAPYYNKEHKETMAITVQDILDKLDEIKVLVEEMKEDEKKDG
jgi:hypothetical protein